MNVKILGTGCANCKRLEAIARQALADLELDAKVEKVEDIADILAYGVMRTPALVVDEKVVLAGRVPHLEEVARLLAAERG